jgi:hypothetical protein
MPYFAELGWLVKGESSAKEKAYKHDLLYISPALLEAAMLPLPLF